MNTITTPWTARSFPFGATGAKTLSVPESACLPHRGVNGLAKAGQTAVAHEVSAMLNEMLAIDLVSVLAAAWRTTTSSAQPASAPSPERDPRRNGPLRTGLHL